MFHVRCLCCSMFHLFDDFSSFDDLRSMFSWFDVVFVRCLMFDVRNDMFSLFDVVFVRGFVFYE